MFGAGDRGRDDDPGDSTSVETEAWSGVYVVNTLWSGSRDKTGICLFSPFNYF